MALETQFLHQYHTVVTKRPFPRSIHLRNTFKTAIVRPNRRSQNHAASLNDIASSLTKMTAGDPRIDTDKLLIEEGLPQPLGASPGKNGVNFAVVSRAATSVNICLFDRHNSLVYGRTMHKTGDTWHVFVANLPHSSVLYGFRVQGNSDSPRWDPSRILLDPYAKHVSGRRRFGVRDDVEKFDGQRGSEFRGTFDFTQPEFDWGRGYKKPNVPLKDLVIYEMPVRTFTADPSSGLSAAKRGSFLGVADKVSHLVDLGVNAVELLPVFEWDELEFQRTMNPRDHMVNIWGYSHMNFFAPMSRFAADGGGALAAAHEFKEMVRQLHAAGIEVILDVVYNHTVEGGDKDSYTLSWRGIDTDLYYQRNHSTNELLNYSGCGNTVNANNPVVMEQIIASLKWWVDEYHVDGFRFDLASCLCRDEQGSPMDAPPLIRALSKDPDFQNVKLIAEPWDIGMYQVGSFPNWDVWCEWNGKFRDDVRAFMRGDAGMKSAFATRIAGSADLYHNHNRKPYHSINFVIAHDGFTLKDLVSYNEKHNEANGEQGRDGCNDNFSWNCGAEGETTDSGVIALRCKQMRNLHVALMVSQGTPMILCGDEYGASRGGNNNWYGHDTTMTHFHWDELETTAKTDGWFRFYSDLIKFRKACPLLTRGEFLTSKDVTWHEDRWDDPESRFLAFTLHDTLPEDRWESGKPGKALCPRGDLYIAFNAHSFEVRVTLPLIGEGKTWRRLVDTNLPSPRDWTPGGNAGVEAEYSIAPYSSIVLVAA